MMHAMLYQQKERPKEEFSFTVLFLKVRIFLQYQSKESSHSELATHGQVDL